MILHEADKKTIQGERIVKIASSFLYVDSGTPVYELLSELKEPYQSAIAVVDAKMRIKDLSCRRTLSKYSASPSDGIC